MRDWIEQRACTVGSMYMLLPRLGIRLKARQRIVQGDEMRVGLRGQVPKVWVPRGMAISQTVQFARKYTYVAIAIDALTGRRLW